MVLFACGSIATRRVGQRVEISLWARSDAATSHDRAMTICGCSSVARPLLGRTAESAMSNDEKSQQAKNAATTTGRLSLAELLARSMEQDGVDLDDQPIERWDEDDGSSGG
jgi:hypothetical protein